MERTVRDVVRRGMSLAHLRPSPKEITASSVRKSFLDFFCENHGHLYISSSPVFSLKDKTLAFVNAGMNQFKDVFLGMVQPASTRVANSQKCVRIGGKHNDLAEVGQDGSHHTFFEMLGNWSFGDYFKKEACTMSWDLLTSVYGIPPERLYVTYFGGDESLGLEPDLEVQQIWRELGIKESHILPFGVKDNFWEGGNTGPCGPCTEIHYDHCPGRTDAGHLVNAGHSDLTEIWNLVFTQYDRKSNGSLEKLHKSFVDTGMGFERLVAVLQGKTSNYDTDLFQPLFDTIKTYSGHSGYTGKYDGNAIDCSYRILADHSRMIAVTLSDGMIPNHQNKVRGIMRKALKVSEQVFKSDAGLLKELTNHVADTLSDAYPAIRRNLQKIHYLIHGEAEVLKAQRIQATGQWKKISRKYPKLEGLDVVETPQLISGVEYIEKNILQKGGTKVTGEVAWFLFDTIGMPAHVTEQLSSKLDLKFNMEDFNQHELYQKKSKMEVIHTEYMQSKNENFNPELISQLVEKKLQPTIDYFKYDYRVDETGNYIFEEQPTTIQAILWRDQFKDEISTDDVKEDEVIGLILDRTQLFSSEGGQESDCGTLTIENKIIFDVKEVVKVKGSAVHYGIFRIINRSDKISVHNIGVIKLDEERRLRIMRNHTALHLLNAAIRNTLPSVAEKESAVGPQKLSLHYMYYNSRNDLEELQKMEKFVRDFILHGVTVRRRILSQKQFQQLDDVVFIPGEAIITNEIPVVEVNSGFKLSREFCPGTHLLNTSHLKDFVITSWKKSGYRVKHVEAVSGEDCEAIRKEDSRVLDRWRLLEEEVSRCQGLNPSQVKEISSKVKTFESELRKSTGFSSVTKLSIIESIKEVKKKLSLLEDTCLRNYVECEVKKVLGDSLRKKFVVHSIETQPKVLLTDLKAIGDLSKDLSKPILVAVTWEDSAIIQCWVPQEFVSKDFSAEKWLTFSLTGSGGIGGFDKNENPDLTYFMIERKFSKEQVERAIKCANVFAEKNILRIVPS